MVSFTTQAYAGIVGSDYEVGYNPGSGGEAGNTWNDEQGMYGARITVVQRDGTKVSQSADWIKADIRNSAYADRPITYMLSKMDKATYLKRYSQFTSFDSYRVAFASDSKYTYIHTPSIPMTIAVGNISQSELIAFFTEKDTLKKIIQDTKSSLQLYEGDDFAKVCADNPKYLNGYDSKTGESYYIVEIEPVAIWEMNSGLFAMTTAEFANFSARYENIFGPSGNQAIDYAMCNLTRRWMPLGAFTTQDYFKNYGATNYFKAYTGSPSLSNGQFLSNVALTYSTGCAMLTFNNGSAGIGPDKPVPPKPVDPEVPDPDPEYDPTAVHYMIKENQLTAMFDSYSDNYKYPNTRLKWGDGATITMDLPKTSLSSHSSCPVCDGSGTIIETCPSCGGSGEDDWTCSTCGGSGEIPDTVPGAGPTDTVTCPSCDGEGSGTDTCSHCDGSGEISYNCKYKYTNTNYWWSKWADVPASNYRSIPCISELNPTILKFHQVTVPRTGSYLFYNLYSQNGDSQFSYPVDKYQEKYTGVFKDAFKSRIITSRLGTKSNIDYQIPLAAYMDNSSYRNIYHEESRNIEAYSYDGYTDIVKDNMVNESSRTLKIKHGGQAQLELNTEVHWNNVYKSSKIKPLSEVFQKYNIRATKTYQAKPNSYVQPYSDQIVYRKQDDGGVSLVMHTKSPTFSFYPTYKMEFATDLNGGTGEAWMLSQGKRELNASNIINITTSNNGTKETYLRSPWSRDREDRVGYPVGKAGMAGWFYGNQTITLDGYYLCQKPSFAGLNGSAAYNAVIAKNNQSRDSVATTINQIANNLLSLNRTTEGSNGAMLGVYSNLWEATSENLKTSPGCSDAYMEPQFDWVKTEKAKTQVKIEGASEIRSYLDKNITSSYTYNRTTAPTIAKGMGLSNGTVTTLSTILESEKDAGTGTASAWYNEEYDGFYISHIQVVIKIDNVRTNKFQFHNQLSDWRTARNETAPSLNYYSNDGKKLLNIIPGYSDYTSDARFGMGVLINMGQFNLGSLTVNNKNSQLYVAPYIFGIRGHSSDDGVVMNGN